ncbi:somatostatin-2 [Amia ocellicauda]|uniref:somatostatin-2 n=1 Tax=Amia ocellicauda TaxID=2972642 RepID=UPI003463B101
MTLLSSVLPVALLVWSVRPAVPLPIEERLALQSNGDLAKERKDFLLKILSGLSDFNGLGKELSGGDREPLKLSQLGERSLYSQPVTRERTPCKNFFWKTFSSC